MYEAACVTGIAAAVRVGAEYKPIDDFGDKYFALYMQFAHGKKWHRDDTKLFTHGHAEAPTVNHT